LSASFLIFFWSLFFSNTPSSPIQVSHDLQLLVQGNAAEDAANDELAEAAAAALIAGRTISANAKKALEVRAWKYTFSTWIK
jgi:hypothetical protein